MRKTLPHNLFLILTERTLDSLFVFNSHLNSSGILKNFAQLIQNLDSTNKTNGKVHALQEYFISDIDDSDKLWALALLSSRAGKRSLRTSDLKELCIEISGLQPWLFEETYHIVGDLAETLAKLLPDHSDSEHHRSLTDWMMWIEDLRLGNEDFKKKEISKAWQSLQAHERFVLNKMIMGGFRIGVSQKLVVKALSKIYDCDESEMSHRLMGNWNPNTITWKQLIEEHDSSLDLSKPYPFFLAHPVEDAFFEKESPSLWAAEHKWDGIRGQAIKRAGEVFLWSRGEELINEQFPELIHALKDIPDNTVLDGEIIPFKNKEIGSFNDLQNRLGRKKITKKILEEYPVAMRFYDVMEINGQDIRQQPWIERRKCLESIYSQLNSNILQISQIIEANTWQELAHERSQARAQKSEGLMLKQKESIYGTGRTKGSWWKWKLDPLTIDAVMIYAMRGHGNRANLYTDYTFAVWLDDLLIPFTKAYSGLTNNEIEEVDRFVKKNTVEKFGPVRSVKPELVFEIAFEGIQPSSRHKSGIALRFPRILRWRKDKTASEANTLQDLKNILNAYG
jgi:DNA ligase-1